MSRWKPDTCACVLEFEPGAGNDPTRFLRGEFCPAHASPLEVIQDNQMKNRAVYALAAEVGGFDGHEVVWRFDAQRNLILTPPRALSAQERVQAQAALRRMNTRIGLE